MKRAGLLKQAFDQIREVAQGEPAFPEPKLTPVNEITRDCADGVEFTLEELMVLRHKSPRQLRSIFRAKAGLGPGTRLIE